MVVMNDHGEAGEAEASNVISKQFRRIVLRWRLKGIIDLLNLYFILLWYFANAGLIVNPGYGTQYLILTRCTQR